MGGRPIAFDKITPMLSLEHQSTNLFGALYNFLKDNLF
jgi:hypothetical protein